MRDLLRRLRDGSRALIRSGQDWSLKHLPPGVRLLVGLLLIAGGLLSILPILGLWMLPLGIAIAALDVVPVLRWVRRKLRGGGPDDETRDESKRPPR